MGILFVFLAALGGFLTGAVWYMALAKPWMATSGVRLGPDGQPENSRSPRPYLISFVAMILVAGMMRHMFAMAGIDGAGKGLVSGLGVGLFLITPWITLNYGYAMRPVKLMAIDGGYAILGCGVIGLILGLF